MARKKYKQDTNIPTPIIPKRMFFALGDQFVFIDHSYQVVDAKSVEGKPCDNCDLAFRCTDAPLCTVTERRDNKSVIFKKIC